jgi:hypothetical protein
VFILAKCRPVSPSRGLFPQNFKTLLWKKENTTNPTWSDIEGCLFSGLRQRTEWSDLVIDGTGKENAEVSGSIPEDVND